MRDSSFLPRMNPLGSDRLDVRLSVRSTLKNILDIRKTFGDQFVDNVTPQDLQNDENLPALVRRIIIPVNLNNFILIFSHAYFYGLLPASHTEPLDLRKAADFTMVC